MAKTKTVHVAFSSRQRDQFEQAREQRLDAKEIAVVMAVPLAQVKRHLKFDGDELRITGNGTADPIVLLVDVSGRRLRKHLRGGGKDADGHKIGPGWLQREGGGCRCPVVLSVAVAQTVRHGAVQHHG
jgi:hypothetical protein